MLASLSWQHDVLAQLRGSSQPLTIRGRQRDITRENVERRIASDEKVQKPQAGIASECSTAQPGQDESGILPK
jgi:hypothetical protein